MRHLLGVTVLAMLSLTLAAVAVAQLPPSGRFVDDDGNAHEANIEAIAALGITEGCNPPLNNRFCPADNVTRGEMAVFLRKHASQNSWITGRAISEDRLQRLSICQNVF